MSNIWIDKVELGNRQGFQKGYRKTVRPMRTDEFSDEVMIDILDLSPEGIRTLSKYGPSCADRQS